MNNKGGPTKIASFLFIIWPSFAALLFCLLLCYFNKLSDNENIFIGTISAIISYSATVSFFLLALPRTRMLRILDKRKHTASYTLALITPAVIGIMQLFFLYLKLSLVSSNAIKFFSNFFFVSTIFQFFWSLIIIILIVFKIRKNEI
ncbi:MAG: hypothetical protein V4591_08845 [Bdellovibrionota bacterium]